MSTVNPKRVHVAAVSAESASASGSASRSRVGVGVGGGALAFVRREDHRAELGPRNFNRDLSWLEFNRRVLAEAGDERVPLLERVKFLAIFTSNLDEFFMKRVGLIKRQVHAGVSQRLAGGLTPREALAAVRALVCELQLEQAGILKDQVLPALAAQDIALVKYAELNPKEQRWADEYFRANIFPALTPLSVDPGHRFPFISNLSDNIGILAKPPKREVKTERDGLAVAIDDETLFARVKVPGTLRRYVPLPARHGHKASRFLPLPELIRNNLDELFPGTAIESHVHFRVTRSAGIQRDDPSYANDSENLLESVEAELKQRRFARAVRIEIEPDADQGLVRELLEKLNLDHQDVYERPGPMDYSALLEIVELDRPDLKEKPWRGVVPARIVADNSKTGIFGAIRRQDILLHHPYDSFRASVEKFIAQAALDPDVLAIKQTLYRTGMDSPFVASLIRAAEAGKQVACLIELRARFDEDRNVRLARQLEKAGVHVAYGVLGLKTHCKTSLVVRKERQGLRCYAHIGTGNYHSKTAQLYTDVGLLTCDPDITSDLLTLFNELTGLAAKHEYHHLLVAPFTMRQRFVQMMDREIENARKGLPARIDAMLNSLEDIDIIEKLYEASQAGVRIRLVVRGFCSLRPGILGVSENIQVISIVGRFLAHSRIFHFAAGQADSLDGEWYIGSADWMYRNLNTRVEAACPVRDPAARKRLGRIMDVSIGDQRNAWDLNTDGSYGRRRPAAGCDPDADETLGTFAAMMREAGKAGV